MSLTLVIILALLSIRQPASAQTVPNREPTYYNTGNNWTTCEEFLDGTHFDAKSILNIDWKIFYFWNPEEEESYNIRFSRPSPVLVDRFKMELERELKPPINWTDAELFMETSIDFSALCVNTTTSGLYRFLPSNSAFTYPSIPYMTFAFKIVEPGYLGIVNCKYRIAYALAPVDKMPPKNELQSAASSFKFYNHYNRTHNEVHWTPPLQSPSVVDDVEDQQDEDLELDDFF